MQPRPRIAVFAGPTATILNSAPLVTSNQARRRHGLPLLTDEWGQPLRFDVLRPQRLARPVTVYVEQFSAHPLEGQAADLYGPPDGYIDRSGTFRTERESAEDVAVYEVELRPEDGPLPLPYMARTRDGQPWDGDALDPAHLDPSTVRQPFYPDASRVFEEIDRVGVDGGGVGNQLSRIAEYDFIRVLPPGGYPHGVAASQRTDVDEGDLAPEEVWSDYFPYRPARLRREPPRGALARVTNRIHAALSSGTDYAGCLWLEGSPFIEETLYWINLLTDTRLPIVGCASPDLPHGTLGASGDRVLVDAARYVASRVWADADGADRIGAVLVSSERIFTARDVQKVAARPDGYAATGGHGGIVGSAGAHGGPRITFLPVHRHTHRSDLRLTALPARVRGAAGSPDAPYAVEVAVKDASALRADAIPHVALVKHARFLSPDASTRTDDEVEILARMASNLDRNPLAGFVVEGGTPYGSAGQAADAALRRATFSGMPVVRTSRGNPEDFVPHERVALGIAGGNLTASKARILLMACMLRFGALPPAADPGAPTEAETQAVRDALGAYQRAFDEH